MPNTDITSSQQITYTSQPVGSTNTTTQTSSIRSQKGKAVDQISQSDLGAQRTGSKGDYLQDPLAQHAPYGGNSQAGNNGTAFSHIDYFQPGIAYISMEVSSILVKSGLELIGTEGELRSTEIGGFESQNAEYAENEQKSIRWQALGAAIMGVVGIAACAGGLVMLRFDVKGAKPDEDRINELQKGIQSKTDELTKPTLTVEKEENSEELVGKAENIQPKAGAKPDENALIDVEVNAEGDGEKKAADGAKDKANGSSDPAATRDEIKQMKSELTALQGKQSTYWGKANSKNQAIQTGINAFGKLGEAGAQVGQAHYAYLRDMEGGLKQTTTQLIDAVGSTYSQTTQFLGSIINSANQNLGTVASMSMRLA
jgi:hypothetical protein